MSSWPTEGRRALAGLGAVGLLSAALSSETLRLSTSYPAGAAVYQRLRTEGVTVLARDGGDVGVGTAAPGAKLDVNGVLRVGRFASPPPRVEGGIYYDTGADAFFGADNAGWKPLAAGNGQIVGRLSPYVQNTNQLKSVSLTLSENTRVFVKALVDVCVGGDAGDAGVTHLEIDGTSQDRYYLRDSSTGAGCGTNSLAWRGMLDAGTHTLAVRCHANAYMGATGYGNNSQAVDFYVHILD